MLCCDCWKEAVSLVSYVIKVTTFSQYSVQAVSEALQRIGFVHPIFNTTMSHAKGSDWLKERQGDVFT